MVKKQKVLKSLLVPNYFKRQNVLTLAFVLFYKKLDRQYIMNAITRASKVSKRRTKLRRTLLHSK